ncbi:alpha/beta hydrolase [Rhizobium hainanense]|uniref:Alpha/beta hydrolase family protein n=1 Tax=Rhizobium hainanense TaxID=52131 RepID=A0A1C3WKQ9_9HYPH|nr:alpha/beta fold hydrolase [Rhizobium hainanense]SCB40446.1 Alpha/beta hydrolase family protein [Rhizobium hainanense]
MDQDYQNPEQLDQVEQALVLKGQGSFAFAGTVLTAENGDTYHCDHGYVQYQIPPNARRYPLVLWHGAGLSGSQYESTPDGREGYRSIFLRRGYSVYIIDQPRQARAGRASKGSVALPDPLPTESIQFNILRLGIWSPPESPQFFPGGQFAQDPASINQFWRLGTLHGTGGDRLDWTGAGEAYDLNTGAVADLADEIGPVVLVTHSGGANQGWGAAMKSGKVKGIVAYEPTNFQFPEGELPPDTGPLQPSHTVPLQEFLKLTKIPIQLVYGDNLDQVPLWTQSFRDARAFVDAINRHGGRAEILHLPAIGIRGNTHFPFSDLNNLKIADLLSDFLHRHDLDGR